MFPHGKGGGSGGGSGGGGVLMHRMPSLLDRSSGVPEGTEHCFHRTRATTANDGQPLLPSFPPIVLPRKDPLGEREDNRIAFACLRLEIARGAVVAPARVYRHSKIPSLLRQRLFSFRR